MIDFNLSESGDIILNDSNKNNKFKMSFRIINNRGFNLLFTTVNNNVKDIESDFRINFSVSNNITHSTKAESIRNLDVIGQCIKNDLMTESGEVHDIDLGSDIYMLKHENKFDSYIIEEIKNRIRESANKFIDFEYDIKLRHNRKEISNLRFNNIDVYIIDNNGEELIKIPINR